MFGLSPELTHSQVVGTIGFISRNIENMEQELVHTDIREDYKDELKWSKEKFEVALAASKAGELPALDELKKKSLVLQELYRLITLIRPFSMKKEQLESIYEKMKNHPDLWSSLYHNKLDTLEQLIKSTTSMPAPGKYFLKAIVVKLQKHLAENEISEEDEQAQNLFQTALSMQEVAYKSFDTQYPLFKAFMNAQKDDTAFDGIVDTAEQQLLVGMIIEHLTPQLSNPVSQERLADLIEPGLLNKALFAAINKIFVEDEQLTALSKASLDSHRLDKDEFEKIVLTARESDEPLLKRITLLSEVALLCKAHPDQIRLLTSTSLKTNSGIESTLYTPESLWNITIIKVVQQEQIPLDLNNTKFHAVLQLSAHLQNKIKPDFTVDSNDRLEKMNTFLNTNTALILKNLPRRIQQLEAMGLGTPTFKEIDAIIEKADFAKDTVTAPIVQEFYLKIQAAKMKLIYTKKDEKPVIKQLEAINANDVQDFFAECCVASQLAATQLDDSRSGMTVIIDVLRAVANWCIRLLSFGISPQFFQKPKTVIDEVSQAITDLKATMGMTLDHLTPEQKPNASLQQ